MNASGPSETSIHIYQTARYHIPQDTNLHLFAVSRDEFNKWLAPNFKGFYAGYEIFRLKFIEL